MYMYFGMNKYMHMYMDMYVYTATLNMKLVLYRLYTFTPHCTSTHATQSTQKYFTITMTSIEMAKR